jgi:Tol biopolymer transport system component/DNA-binding winged helix-turn-helix (wHTH) protein
MPSPAQSSTVVRFDAFELNLKTGELHMSGVKIRLQEQSFQILASLLEQPGKLVTRESLQERLWPNDTFVDFDKSLNIAVSKLRQALGDSAAMPRLVETLPRRGYRFIAAVEQFDESGEIIGLPAGAAAPSVSSPDSPPGRAHARWYMVAACSAAALTIAWWISFSPRLQKDSDPMQVIPLTSYPGIESQPDLSPDGEHVAFSWDGDDQGKFDIYVKPVHSGIPVRLTTHPAVEEFPVWSPDGRWIGFLRRRHDYDEIRTGYDVLVIPTTGGPERKVAAPERGGKLAWLPSSRGLILSDEISSGQSALFAVWIETGEKQQLTEPPPGTLGDFSPLLSEDARLLAFSRFDAALFTSDVYLLDLDTNFRPLDTPRKLTSVNYTRADAWAPDGKSLIVSRVQNVFRRDLWRLSTTQLEELHKLDIAGPGSNLATVSAARNRLVYVRESIDMDLEVLEKNNSPDGAWRINSFPSSTRLDSGPAFSPDGQWLAFESDRLGLLGIWLSKADGTNPQLRWAEGPAGMPRWSPDGERIVLDSSADGDFNVYIVIASGGPAFRLTDHPAYDMVPSWSADGRWIYFASNRSGKFEIWKASVAGGEPQQVTQAGGTLPMEAPDGRFVYYLGAQGVPITGYYPLWRVPIRDSEPTKVLDRVWARNYAITKRGIYFVEQPDHGGPGAPFAFRCLDLESGEIRTLLTLPPDVVPGHSFAVSPDEQTILYTRVKVTDSDLMLIENFR